MTRFFVTTDRIDGSTVTFAEDDALHLSRVLRMGVGDRVAVLDGSGRSLTAELTVIERRRAVATIVAEEMLDTEPRVALTIAQSLPKSAEKIEWVLQHAVEIGASRFVLFRSRRSDAGKLAERPERWAKIVKTAAEQSGRTRLPEVAVADGIERALAEVSRTDLVLFCDETEAAVSLKSALSDASPLSVAILIGPEGGWSPDERVAAIESGARPVSLGPRILRTETAALSAASQLLFALDGR